MSCDRAISVPGFRPAVNLTSLATSSSCDCTVMPMRYISLISAGGSWLSWTEIFGTLDITLSRWYQGKQKIGHCFHGCIWKTFWSLTDYMVLGCMVRLFQSSSLCASLSRSHPRDNLLAWTASWADATSPPAPLQVKKTQRPQSLPSITSSPVTYWQIQKKCDVIQNPFASYTHSK